MALTHNASVARSGLVLHLDAANPKSYPGTGTVWTDISGNGNNHNLVDSPVFNSGKFSLNGSSQGFSRSAPITGASATCTVVIWYSTTDGTELWARGNLSNGFYLSASSGNNYYHAQVGAPTNFVDLVPVINPATPVNYRNGVFRMWEAKNVNFTTWTNFEWFLYPSPWLLAGTVGSIQVYNRELTATESAQNFEAYRGRYGI